MTNTQLMQHSVDQLSALYALWQENLSATDGMKFSEFLEHNVQNFQMEEEGYTMGTD
jgi:hypothetical protein